MRRLVNPLVGAILRSRAHGLLSRWVALITVTGRRTGRPITVPVDYRWEGDRIAVMTRAGRQWWRNLENERAVTLRLRGRSRGGRATVARSGDRVDVLIELSD